MTKKKNDSRSIKKKKDRAEDLRRSELAEALLSGIKAKVMDSRSASR